MNGKINTIGCAMKSGIKSLVKNENHSKRTVELGEKDKLNQILPYKDLVHIVYNMLSGKDLLSCRQVCQAGLILIDAPYDRMPSIFQSRFFACLTFDHLCQLITGKKKKNKISLACLPQNLPLKINIKSINSLKLLAEFFKQPDLFKYNKKLVREIQIMDLTDIIGHPWDIQFSLEKVFSNRNANPFMKLKMIKMRSVFNLIQPPQNQPFWRSFGVSSSGQMTITGINTLEVLECNDIGLKDQEQRGVYDICNLPNLKSLFFGKLASGPMISLHNLPSLETISIKKVCSNFEILLSEVPSLNHFLVNGKKVPIDRNQGNIVFSFAKA